MTDEKPKEDKYQSREGFEQVVILRGVHELMGLAVDLCNNYPNDIFFCGGHVRWMCSSHPTPVPGSDVDIYFKTQEAFDATKARLEDEEGWNLETRFENEISIQYRRPKDPGHGLFALPYIQLIKPMVEGAIVATGEMQEILENFDFTVARVGFHPTALLDSLPPYYATADADFMHDEAARILRIKNIHCPISSTYRAIKYCRKGYWIPTRQVHSLFIDWETRDDEYRSKITDFLAKEDPTEDEINEAERLMMID